MNKFKFNPRAKSFIPEEKEFKKEKEGKKTSKLKQIIKQKIIKPKIIEEDNKFFFWKDLIQQYSYKNSMCIFIEGTEFLEGSGSLENKTLLPDNLRQKLIDCFEYKQPIKEIFLENLTEYKIDTFDKEFNKIKDKLNLIYKFLKKDKIVRYTYSNLQSVSLREMIKQFMRKIFISNKNVKIIEEQLYIQISIEYSIEENIELYGIKKAICMFITIGPHELIKRLQRQIIECMERTLAMNMNSLSLSNKIRVLRILEEALPSIDFEHIRKLKKELKIKPLYFQIYDTALKIPTIIKNGPVISALDKITNVLNQRYKNELLKKKSHDNYLIATLKYISTLTYFRDFVYEITFFNFNFGNEKFMTPRTKYFQNEDIIEEVRLIKHIRKGQPKWDDNKTFKTLKDFILYLIEHLLLYGDVLIIKNEQKEQEPKEAKFEGSGSLKNKIFRNKYAHELDFAIISLIEKDKRFGKVEYYSFLKHRIFVLIVDTFTDIEKEFGQEYEILIDKLFEITYDILKDIYPDLIEDIGINTKSYNKFNDLINHIMLYVNDKYSNVKRDEVVDIIVKLIKS